MFGGKLGNLRKDPVIAGEDFLTVPILSFTGVEAKMA